MGRMNPNLSQFVSIFLKILKNRGLVYINLGGSITHEYVFKTFGQIISYKNIFFTHSTLETFCQVGEKRKLYELKKRAGHEGKRTKVLKEGQHFDTIMERNREDGNNGRTHFQKFHLKNDENLCEILHKIVFFSELFRP